MKTWQLRQRQSLPLDAKLVHTEHVIRKWYEYWDGDVYVSFSGGKDSTVLLDIVRSVYPDTPAVFVNTGLEYPEIVKFVKAIEKVDIIRPKMNFRNVLKSYGYPVVSKIVAHYINTLQNPTPNNVVTRRLRLEGIKKDGTKADQNSVLSQKWRFLIDAPFKISPRCCDVMKKEPFNRYARETGRQPYTGVMASESAQRERTYLRGGCNSFSSRNPNSSPLSIWTEQDILEYIITRDLPYAECYGEIIKNSDGQRITTGEKRTGCMFCMFGLHLEPRPNRFERMRRDKPKLWNYCINSLGLGEVLDYVGIPYGKELQMSFDWE